MLRIREVQLHDIMELVSSDSIGVQKRHKVKFLDEFRDDVDLDELEFYICKVGFALSHSLTWAEQLDHALHFIVDFGNDKRAQDQGIRRSHHLIYNIENYLIRLQSIYDRLLQLVNAIFHLGVSAELVNHALIVSNVHVARTKVPALLRAVRIVIEGKKQVHAQARHDLIHKHSSRDPELQRLELFYMHTESTYKTDEKRSWERFKTFRAGLARKVTMERKAQFKAINDALNTALLPLLDELLLQYKRQKGRIQKLV